ncbi:hydroxypyruvate isomerase family protein [Pseudonocardia sp. CA-107938]|uniref:hydroxypyruvate isomerase family protein n=1 Tax=Pseudonocardia sp. CA-107938 TaxID=3240021 RepID=UPI003D904479
MTSWSVNCSILFTELPLLERPAAAAAAGFDAVEFWWPFDSAAPADADVEAFARAIEDAGVTLSALNLAAGDMAAGDRGLISWPGRENEVRDSIDVAAALGKRLGTIAFNALYGNRLDGVDPRDQDAVALQNLGRAAALLDGTVVLEPLSGMPAYPLKTAADALAVADQVEVALLFDLYHLAVNGDDLAAVIAQHADRIGHVQIADAPGRHEPGTGEVPLMQHLTALAAAGYRGRVGLEYVPTTTSERAFDWMKETS